MENKPERRVFYIDIGDTDSQSDKAYLEHLFFEFENKDTNGTQPN
jgi:hypothetical protein